MIVHADGGNDAFVVVRAEIARHAHGVCAVGHVKAQHAAAFLQAAARHGDNIALYHYPPGFQRDRAHGDALLLYHPAVEHVPCDGAARGLGRGLHQARRGLRRGVRGLYHGVVQREHAADKLAQLCFLRQRRHRGKPRAHGHAAACRLDLHVRHVCLVKPPQHSRRAPRTRGISSETGYAVRSFRLSAVALDERDERIAQLIIRVCTEHLSLF